MNFVLSLLISQVVFGFTILESSSPEAVWTDIPLKIYYNPTNCPSEIKEVILDSIKLWNNVSTSRMKFDLQSDPITVDALTLYNGGAAQFPAISCDSHFAADFADLDPNFIAGYGFYSRTGSTMAYGGLIINADPSASARVGLMNHDQMVMLVTHELGHVLGLGHASTQPCMMYYSLGTKTTARLAQDDEDAVSYLYPRDELSKDKFFGCGSIHNRKGRGWPFGFLLVLPALVMLYLRIRKLSWKRLDF